MTNVEVKGWRNGLLLIVAPEPSWEIALESLETRLEEANARSFWKGSPTVLDFGGREVDLERLDALIDHLKGDWGLIPTTVVSAEALTRQAGERLVLTTYAELPPIQKAGAAPSPVPSASALSSVDNNARYVRRGVRSGQRVEHDGHLVICGDVNPGAEVAAAGDIVVLGSLRGVAHAGCYGDESARIVALALRPPQLRIAGRSRARRRTKRARGSIAPKSPASKTAKSRFFRYNGGTK